MSRNIFGWDLPPGCSAGDIERAFGDGDDTCCAFCQSALDDDPADDSWGFQGFCDSVCALEYGWLMIKKYPNKNYLHDSVYSDFDKALRETIERVNQSSNSLMI